MNHYSRWRILGICCIFLYFQLGFIIEIANFENFQLKRYRNTSFFSKPIKTYENNRTSRINFGNKKGISKCEINFEIKNCTSKSEIYFERKNRISKSEINFERKNRISKSEINFEKKK